MDLNLEGKNALVCGSTQGIGKATAHLLATMGANVILVSRNKEKLEQVQANLPRPNGQQHGFIAADFSKPGQLKTALEDWKANHELGLHILINNTGGPPGGPAHQADIEAYRAAFNQHLVCNQLLAQFAIEDMKAAGTGRIINVISTSVKQPLDNLGVSNTIRGAVANWAKTLSNELGPFGITVNNVLPGATETERLAAIISNKAAKSGKTVEEVAEAMKGIVPARRFAKPEEIANAIAFLVSDAAAYINGINLPVDGGRTKSL